MNRQRVLVVGVGSIGERHVRCFGATGRAEVAVCEINAELRQAIAERYQVVRAFADLDAALGESFDAAVVCTPAHLHIPMATRLAQSGVHLLIEKPLSTSLEGVAALEDAVSKANIKAAVAYVLRAHPVLAAMKRQLDSGRFGRPVQIVFQSGQHFPTYRPAYRDIYYARRATGGGAIQDALTHGLNAGEWLVGPIRELCADASHQVLDGVDVEDTAHVLTRQAGALGCYSLNQYQAPNELTITVVCERGAARFENHHNRWRWMIEPGAEWIDEPGEPLARDDLFVRQAAAFLDFVDGKSPPLCSLDDAIQTLRVNLAVLEAADAKQWRVVAKECSAADQKR